MASSTLKSGWKVWKTNEPIDSNTTATFPTNYNELIVNVRLSGSSVIYGHYVLSSAELSSSIVLYRSGYYESAQYYGDVVCYISNAGVKGFFRSDGITRTTVVDIYYR